MGYLAGHKTWIPVKGVVGRALSSAADPRVTGREYQPVICPIDGLVIATFGQSNSTNNAKPVASIKVPDNLFQYDWKTNRCYRYREPLLAVEGVEGNVITYAAVRIATGSKSAVTVVPFGVGGISVLQWAHGYLHYQNQTDFVLRRISNRGLSPSTFLWHQDEADSRHEGLAAGEFGDPRKYASSTFMSMQTPKIDMMRGCLSEHSLFSSSWIAASAREVLLRLILIAIVQSGLRYDGCHFSPKGAEELGARC